MAVDTRDLVDLPVKLPVESGPWVFDERDALLYALLTDPVYISEVLWKDPPNREYAGCYRVRDYQYRLRRLRSNYAIAACARAVGKTESEKAHAETHIVKEQGENLLITAPQMIHLLPVTRAIESHIRDIKLFREFLDGRHGQTGFTHKPFQVDFLDGTKIIGRIPNLDGKGVKAMHQPFLIVEEGQDYPENGWTEVNETVNYDATDGQGRPRFRYWVYGVHSGNTTSTFDEKARSPVYEKIQVTQLMRPDWGKPRKENAIANYGGSSSPDYRRNILGEPGAGAGRYFVTARVMACVDQKAGVEDGQKASDYNAHIYQHQKFRAEELDTLGMNIADLLDLPEGTEPVWSGMDIGLTTSPTEIIICDEVEVNKKMRLRTLRRFTLERFRTKTLRQALYTIGWHFGGRLLGVGIDSTGIGLPIFQDIEDDELVPPHLLNVATGYFFNSKVPVNVEKKDVNETNGIYRDQFGNMVKREVDPVTGLETFITYMPFIMASTKYLRDEIDPGRMLFPFDKEIISDFLGETKTRVENVGRRSDGQMKKGDAFHILDAYRALAMRRREDAVFAALAPTAQVPVLDIA